MVVRKIIPYKKYLVPLARELRKRMTYTEVILWEEIKNKQILRFDFDKQRPINKFIVDFYCKDLSLAIEIDGFTHDHSKAFKKDMKRQETLEKLGVRFLRFDDDEIKNDLHNVLLEIEGWIIKENGL